jgi:hypothetical protein
MEFIEVISLEEHIRSGQPLAPEQVADFERWRMCSLGVALM